MTDEDFAFELMRRLSELVWSSETNPEESARAARRLIRALTPIRATIEHAQALVDHPSIPVCPIDDSGTVVAGWLSIINGLCGPNDRIEMTFGTGRIDFVTNHFDPASEEAL